MSDKELKKAALAAARAAEYEVVRAEAESGKPDAQYKLAIWNINGSHGLAKDEKTAVSWFAKAAEQSHAKSQLLLGCHLLQGHGVPEDACAAVKWFTRCASHSHSRSASLAQLLLFLCLWFGIGAERDEKAAMEWCRQAANAKAEGAAGAMNEPAFAAEAINVLTTFNPHLLLDPCALWQTIAEKGDPVAPFFA